MLVSVVIPTYSEEIYGTLEKLVTKQTAFSNNGKNIEIILADYDPDDTRVTRKEFKEFEKDFPFINCKIVDVERKGIAFARHVGIVNSKGHTIMNFDADSYFSTPKAIDKLTLPILRGEVVLTCCANIMDSKELNGAGKEKDDTVKLVMNTMDFLTMIQKHTLTVIYEPGLCFSRYAYDYANGYNDVKQSEGLLLASRIVYNHGFNSKRFIDDVTVITSPRRAIAASQVGLLNSYANYDNAFRLNKDGSLKSFI